MANYNCSACSELRENAPNVIVNGITETECNYLKNNGGLSGQSDNCTDLERLNDCLVGNMEDEVDAFEVCEWKPFMKNFIPNVWTTMKGIICAICGVWKRLEQIECTLGYMTEGTTFRFDEATDGDAYVVAGKGVSFLKPGSGEHQSNVALTYIAGGLINGSGSYAFYDSDFTDDGSCGNFDLGGTYRESTARKGNSVWASTGEGAKGGELIAEFRLKKSAFPQIGRMFRGFGIENLTGGYNVALSVFDGDDGNVYAYGQHGWCETDGSVSESGYDPGHLVPKGWIYLQLRMSYIWVLRHDGNVFSPRFFMGVRLNPNEIEC